jgi:hypothetical protein
MHLLSHVAALTRSRDQLVNASGDIKLNRKKEGEKYKVIKRSDNTL